MALFMDSHAIDGGVKASDVAQAHLADLQAQDRYGVRHLRYWVDEQAGKIFCLVDAPDAEAAIRVHREAHGHRHGHLRCALVARSIGAAGRSAIFEQRPPGRCAPVAVLVHLRGSSREQQSADASQLTIWALRLLRQGAATRSRPA